MAIKEKDDLEGPYGSAIQILEQLEREVVDSDLSGRMRKVLNFYNSRPTCSEHYTEEDLKRDLGL